MQSGRHLESVDLARDSVPPFLGDQATVVQQHADDFHGIERDAFRARDDLPAHRAGQTGDEALEQLLHGLAGQPLEVEARVVALIDTPRRPSLTQLGPRQGHDQDGELTAPSEQVLDEIEEPLVRPVEVLEDHDRRSALGDPLEERAPGGKGLFILSRGRIFDAEQGREVGG